MDREKSLLKCVDFFIVLQNWQTCMWNDFNSSIYFSDNFGLKMFFRPIVWFFSLSDKTDRHEEEKNSKRENDSTMQPQDDSAKINKTKQINKHNITKQSNSQVKLTNHWIINTLFMKGNRTHGLVVKAVELQPRGCRFNPCQRCIINRYNLSGAKYSIGKEMKVAY